MERMTDRAPNRRTLAGVVLVLLIGVAPVGAIRLKDIADVAGVRDNQLLGYGLVVGLNGTGDGTQVPFTLQSLEAFLKRHGISLLEDAKPENVAAVVVTAKLPPFAKAGQKIDVVVSSVGDAENLQGGTLLMTPLRAGDGHTYAVAQGAVSTGGFKAQQGGSSIQENHPTVGKVSNGALIEREPATEVLKRSHLTYLLKNPDFVTALRVAEGINSAMDQRLAHAEDATGVSVLIPAEYRNRVVEFISYLEMLPVHPDQKARIVLEERTGTLIMGENVRISTVAVAHGSLSILITSEEDVSQPLPFSQGQTAITGTTAIQVDKERPQEGLTLLPEAVTITELVAGLNALGVSPRDLIAILQAIKRAGAMQADLEVI